MNFLREYMGSNNNHNDILQFQGWTTDDTVVEDISPTEEAFNSFVSAANIMEAISSKENNCESESSNTDQEDEAKRNDVKAEPRSPHHVAEKANSPQTDRIQENIASVTEKVRSVKKLPFVSNGSKKPKEHRLRSKLRKKTNKLLHHASMANTRTNQDDSDDDLYFFKSLIPYVKALSPTRKLCLRSEIHNLVLREIMTECSNSSQTVIPLEHVSVGLNA